MAVACRRRPSRRRLQPRGAPRYQPASDGSGPEPAGKKDRPPIVSAYRFVARLGAALLVAAALVACRRAGEGPRSPAAVAQAWIAACNDGRRDRLLALLDEDAIVWWPVTAAILRGRHEVEPHLDALAATVTAPACTVRAVFVDEVQGTVAIDRTLRATDVATGRPVVVTGVDLLEVRNGFVTALRGVFDTTGLPTPRPAARAAP